jgi:outer membrane protein TolC
MNREKFKLVLTLCCILLYVPFFSVAKEKRVFISNHESTALSQIQLLKIVCEKNFEIIYNKYDMEIASQQVKKEQEIFDSDLVVSYNYKESVTPNTAEEYYDRIYMDKFKERSYSYQTGVKKLLPFGTLLSFDYTIDEIHNDLVDQKNEQIDEDISKETSTFLGFQLTQPLLKNRGPENTKAKIRIAKTIVDISEQEYRQKVIDIVATALNNYWELYYTIKQYDIYKNSVKIANDLLITNIEMVEAGKVPETDLFEIRSALALRRSLLSAAYQKVITAQNSIFKLSGKSRRAEKIKQYIPVDSPDYYYDSSKLDYDKIVKYALLNNPGYLARSLNVKKQDIHVAYAKNQALPELNVKASYGINSLDKRPETFWEHMWTQNDETWSIGMYFSMPLTGKINTNSELRVARIRKKQALLALRSITIDFENQIDTSIQKVKSSRVQVERHIDNVNFKQKLMDIEISNLKEGKSSSTRVLEMEKELNQAKNGKLRAIVNLELSGIELSRVDGSLLEKYNVDIGLDNK